MGNALRGERVCLEPLSVEHINHYLLQFSQKVRSLLRVSDRACERAYLMQKLQDKYTTFYVIKEKSGDELIGALEIRNPGYRSQLYCWINERWWGTGCFQEAIALATNAYFSLSESDTLSARVDCTNLRSLHAFKKAGFESQGVVNGAFCKQYQLIRKK